MLLDPTAQQIGVGGTVAVLMTAAVLKFLPAFMRALKDRNGGHKASDEAAVDARVRAVVQKENESLMADIRLLMESRNMTVREKVTDPIVAAIEKTRHDIRNVVSEALADAYRKGKRSE